LQDSRKPKANRKNQEREIMLRAFLQMSDQPNGEQGFPGFIDFETISELEGFLAYNRAHILTINFTGELTREGGN
jgi:hypothetical protein